MLDPKSAAKLGSSLGKGLSDQVFGIVDDVRNAKNIKAANNQRIINQNKVTEINNQVVRNNNRLREQAMREIAAEQEASMIAKMSPAQREAYYKAKVEAAKEAQRLEREAKKKKEEFWQIFWTIVVLAISIPLLGGMGYVLFLLAK
jgi:preprotein translocase subunit Sss1